MDRRSFLKSAGAVGTVLLGGGLLTGCPSDVPADIDAMEGTDVTGALRQWIESLPAGATGRLTAGRTYMVDTLLLEGGAVNANVTLDLNGAVVFKGAESLAGSGSTRGQGYREPVFDLLGLTNFTIHNGTIVGHHFANDGNYLDWLANPTTYAPTGGNRDSAYVTGYEWNHGVLVDNCTGTRLHDLTIRDVHGDGVGVGPAWSGNNSLTAYSTRIENVDVRRTGRMGFAAWQADGFDVIGGSAVGIGRAALDLEPMGSFEFVRNVHIDGVHIGSHKNYAVAAAGEYDVDDVLIENLTFDDGGLGVYDENGDLDTGNALIIFARSRGTGTRNNWTIRNCTHTHAEYLPAVPEVNANNPDPLQDGQRRLISIKNSDSVTITGNTQLFQPGDPGTIGVSLEAVGSFTVTGNTWTNVDQELELVP